MGETAENRRAQGRSLADFWLDGEEGKLHPAEQQLVEACRTGEPCILPGVRPEKSDPARLVRAGLLRFLALGGDAATPVHEHGVQLMGAWIDGPLDLEGATVPGPLVVIHSRIQTLLVFDARLRGLSLDGSCVEAGIAGDGLHCEGNVFLSDGFRAAGAVRLLGAEIGGNLDCSGGTFDHAGGNALHCDGAKVAGSVFLSDRLPRKGRGAPARRGDRRQSGLQRRHVRPCGRERALLRRREGDGQRVPQRRLPRHGRGAPARARRSAAIWSASAARSTIRAGTRSPATARR